MKDFDSNRIYQTLGDEFKNIYIVDCEDQQIHTFKETLKLPGFSSCTSYNDAMNQYIDDSVFTKRIVTCYEWLFRLTLYFLG